VYRVSSELAIVQTVDFFTPVVDEPYWFGAIAAANSLSDVYAMGGTPAFALNIVAFPRNSPAVPLSALGEILRGGSDKAKEAGIEIVGGHTVDDNEPKYGLAVTGFVHPQKIWRNVGARPGDKLVLTKPLGTGIITTALRAGKAGEQAAQGAIESMAVLNAAAAEVGRRIGVRACTDVTGFGLLAHLLEMLTEGNVGARIEVSAVPVLPGTRELLEQGFVPGGTRRNRQCVAPCVSLVGRVSEEDMLLLCDAQTSGGLLFAVAADRSARLVEELRAAGVRTAAEVGQVNEALEKHIEVVS
jgi:selenide,water dikinase